jgi:hypothetical protein
MGQYRRFNWLALGYYGGFIGDEFGHSIVPGRNQVLVESHAYKEKTY